MVSPFFNSRPKLISLFKYLKKKYPNINLSDINKENISSVIYPREKYNDTKVRKLISDFIFLYEKFLSYLEMNKLDGEYEKTILLEVLQKKGLERRYEHKYKEICETLRGRFVKDDAHYRNFVRIEMLNSFHAYNNGKEDELGSSLQNASDNIDFYFIFSKLHVFREMIIRQIVSRNKLNFKMEFFDDIVKYVNVNIEKIKKEHPNLYIIYLTLMATVKGEDNYINELISYVKINEAKFDKERLSYYFNYIVSYFWTKINIGKTEYSKNIFELYQYMVEKGFFKTEKYVDHIWINNVVNIGLMRREHDWLVEFLDKYKNDIEPNFSEYSYNLSLAKINFQKGDYNETLKYLQKVEYKDPNYYIHSKSIFAKVFYELGDLQQIEYIIDSLKHYASRNTKMVEQQISNIHTMVKYFNWLLKLKTTLPEDAPNMKISLDNENSFVPNKDWFYKKLEQFALPEKTRLA